MALAAYRFLTTSLLQAPSSSIPLLDNAHLDACINTGRGQVAGEGECIRIYGTLDVAAAAQQYPFTAITFPTGTVGVQGVLNVRMATYQIVGVPGGNVTVTPREWEFFNTFILSQAVPPPGPPAQWAQFGQGINGTLFVNLLDQAYTLNLDTVCVPTSMATDTDPEAIPGLWIDAIPYYAAWMALEFLQRQADADKMFERYEMMMKRARQFATPSVLPGQYVGGPDPMMASRIGVTAGKAA